MLPGRRTTDQRTSSEGGSMRSNRMNEVIIAVAVVVGTIALLWLIIN
jgi:hypothetical protein